MVDDCDFQDTESFDLTRSESLPCDGEDENDDDNDMEKEHFFE